jgi:hypothetical protein
LILDNNKKNAYGGKNSRSLCSSLSRNSYNPGCDEPFFPPIFFAKGLQKFVEVIS